MCVQSTVPAEFKLNLSVLPFVHWYINSKFIYNRVSFAVYFVYKQEER